MDKWSLIRELAASLGAKPETVKKWRQRGIPPGWLLPLRDAARERAAELSEQELLALSSRPLSTTSRSAA